MFDSETLEQLAAMQLDCRFLYRQARKYFDYSIGDCPIVWSDTYHAIHYQECAAISSAAERKLRLGLDDSNES